MKREDDQQLWDLLDHARQVELSPFFARNIVRKVRERRQRFEWLRSAFRPRKLVPAAGLLMAIIAAMLALHQPAPRGSSDGPPDVIATIDPQDYDVVADLDELMAADENNLWDDDTQTL